MQTQAKRYAGFVRYVAGRFNKDRAASMAASLSYTSLLSLVPLLAIALAMLAAFPVFDSIRKDLMTMAFQNFVPSVGSVVQTQVDRFMANAGKLTAAGVVGLVFTAVMLLVTIEDCFNRLFRVARQRSALSKLLVYWTVLTLGPLLIGASLSLQGYLTAAKKWELTQVISPVIAMPLPFVLSALAFTGLFAAIPNRRVRLKDALIGGIVAALLFAGLRWGFAIYITSSKAYTNLYGAVAAVPIFLFWMFLSWAVVLIGAEVTAALPEWRAGYHQAERRAQGARRLTLALDVLALLLKASLEATQGLSRRDLLDATAVSERDLSPVLRRLCSTGFAAPLVGSRFLLARDLQAATLDDLIVALELELTLDDAIATSSPWRAKVEERITAARQAHRETLCVPLRGMLTAEE
ncbi:MAG: YihY family inner membrane protein [Rhodospirillaceae bacterium]|nr:YihY family inner membrane protein [Rhodospirillales bacterium]